MSRPSKSQLAIESLGSSGDRPSLAAKEGNVLSARNQSHFLVHPPALNFDNFQAGIAHVQYLKIQNTSKRNKRVRIVPPVSHNFTVESSDAFGNMAPGLTVTLRVTFFSSEEGITRDRLLICSDEMQVEVPVLACPPVAEIRFPATIDLGMTVLQGSVAQYVDIQNCGHRPGAVTFKMLETDASAVVITPAFLILGPAGHAEDRARVRFELLSSAADQGSHAFRASMKVDTLREVPDSLRQYMGDAAAKSSDNESARSLGSSRSPRQDGPVPSNIIAASETRPLQVKVQAVEQTLELLPASASSPRGLAGDRSASAAPLSELFFGNLYFGQKRVFRARLVNNCPCPASFAASVPSLDTDEKMPGSGQPFNLSVVSSKTKSQADDAVSLTSSEQSSKSEITVSPPEGVVPPFSEVPIEITFCPAKRTSANGYKSQLPDRPLRVDFRGHVHIESVATQQLIRCAVTATASEPLVSLDQYNFAFGEVPVFDRADFVATLTNRSDLLPASFKFEKCAHFHVSPHSGRLEPLQECRLVVSFVPRQLGSFTRDMSLTLVDGLQQLHISLQGTASKIGDKQEVTVGTKRLPIDFQPKIKTVTDSNFKPPARFVRPATGRDLSHLDEHGLASSGTEEEIEYRLFNRDRFNGVLEEARLMRESQQLAIGKIGVLDGYAKPSEVVAKEFYGSHGLLDQIHLPPDDQASLGIRFASGMQSPRPSLPKSSAVEPLWTQKASKTGPGATRLDRNLQNPLKLIAKKFKPGPSTPAESRDCEASLSQEQLAMIDCGPKLLDFGIACVNSQTARNFSVTNRLSQYIVVALQLDAPELSALQMTTPRTQVVPPGQTAGFDVILKSATVQQFKRNVYYTINGGHSQHFLCSGEVVNVSLQTSTTELSLRFAPDNYDFKASEQVTLTNTFSVPVEYFWNAVDESGQPSSVFSVSPAKGSVPSGKSIKAEVVYAPSSSQKAVSELLNLHIVGGPKQSIRCSGFLADASCTLKPKAVELGTVSVGSSVTKHLSLKNSGKSVTVFRISPRSLPEAVTIAPLSGALDIGASVTLSVTFAPTKALAIEQCAVPIEYRGRTASSKPLAIDITGQSIMPDVTVQQQELAFGGVLIGSDSTQQVTLKNASTISASLKLDLSTYPEYQAVFPQMNPPVVAHQSPLNKPEEEYSETSRDDGKSEDKERNRDCVFDLVLPAGSERTFQLTFAPRAVQAHRFTLPLSLIGIAQHPGVTRTVTASGLQPRLSLDPSPIDFDKCLVLRAERARKHPYSMLLRIRNTQPADSATKSKPIKWRALLVNADGSELVVSAEPDLKREMSRTRPSTSVSTGSAIMDDSGLPWRIAPNSGVLPSGDTVALHVYFAPTSQSVFTQHIGFFIDEDGAEEDQKPYLITEMRGQGVLPSLSFDVAEVILPPAPLGIQTQAIFNIVNHGYESLDIAATLSENLPVSVAFPKGSLLAGGTTSLPVEVSFQSSTPISFSSFIHFADNVGTRFSVPIHGCADNSVLSTNEFLMRHKDEFQIVAEGNRAACLLTKSEAVAAKQSDRRDSIAPSVLNPAESEAQFVPPIPSARDSQGNGTESEVEAASSHAGSGVSPDLKNEITARDQQTIHFVLAYLRAAQLLPFSISAQLLKEGPMIPGTEQESKLSLKLSQKHSTESKPSSFDLLALAQQFAPVMASDGCITLFQLVETVSGVRLKAWNEQHRPQPLALASSDPKPRSRSPSIAAAGQSRRQSFDALNTARSGATAITSATSIPEENEDSRPGTATARTKASSAVGSASGSRPNTPPSAGPQLPSGVRDAIERAEIVLLFLRTSGAMIPTVRPEYLLPAADYSVYLNFQLQAGQGSDDLLSKRRQSLQRFALRARRAWLNVLMQVVKLFLLQRLTVKGLKALPGVPTNALASFDPANCSGSNLYSTGENVLLKWLSAHYDKVYAAQNRPLSNFEGDLRDSLVFAAALQSHIPDLASLEHMTLDAKTHEQMLHNATAVVQTMKSLGLNYRIEPEEVLTASARDLVLFALYLYQTLPNFVPRATIEFSGKLNEEILKTIEITNPSKKPLNYNVRLEGSNDFAIEQYTLRLEPKGAEGSSASFPIRFKSRFSRPVEGRLLFTSETDPSSGSANAATLVFQLKSNVHSTTPTKSFSVTSRVYESQRLDVEVTNPFSTECSFSIALTQSSPNPLAQRIRFKHSLTAASESQAASESAAGTPTAGDASARSKFKFGRSAIAAPKKKTLAESASLAKVDLADAASVPALPDAFFCSADTMKLKGGESALVQVMFLPFEIGKYTLQMVFLDERAGEFMYEVAGNATAPQSVDSLKWNVADEGGTTRSVNLPYRNSVFEQARSTAITRLKSGIKGRKKDELPRWATELSMPAPVLYQVSLSSPYFSAPKVKAVNPDRKPPKQESEDAAVLSPRNKAEPEAESGNPIKITFTPKGPGCYRCEATVQSLYDIRVYEIQAVVAAKGVPTTLEFSCAARQKLSQAIPFHNPTDDQWTLKATLNGNAFSGPSELVVPPQSSKNYPLTFSPEWMGDARGNLVLVNSRTGDKHLFDMIGKADEPLAEEEVEIEVAARSTVERKIRVKNYKNQDVNYTVETDLPNVSGASTLFVRGNSASDYTLKVSPTLSGEFSGTITFQCSDGSYVWFPVDVHATTPEPECEIAVSAALHQGSVVEIGVSNPLEEPVAFDVSLQPASELFGDTTFWVAAGQSAVYQLVFSPLTSGQKQGLVAFSNPKVGEFWYKLNLSSERVPPTHLPMMRCPIGSTVAQTITLRNPSDQTVTLQAEVTHCLFAAKPRTVTLSPHAEADVSIEFTAADVGEKQEGIVAFFHPVIGEWVYTVTGVGAAPEEMPITTLSTTVHSKATGSITFRNPLSCTVGLEVGLEDPSGSFELMLKRSGWEQPVPPQAALTLPFNFAPAKMTTERALIRLRAVELGPNGSPLNKEPLEWVYPVQGIVQGPTSTEVIEIKCQCRQSVEEERELSLPGLVDADETFTAEVTATELQFERFVTNSLHVELVGRPRPGSSSIRAKLIFEPLKPVSTTTTLTIHKASGGCWRFPLSLESSEGPVDDIITIEAPINKTATVRFTLTNQFDFPAPFKAFLTPATPQEFNLYPTAGVLPAISSGQEGAQFQVSFSPVEYGKMLTGQLVVVTEDMQWSYELRGVFPKYVPPQGRATLTTRLSPNVMQQLEQANQPKNRNYVNENRRKTATAFVLPPLPGAQPAPNQSVAFRSTLTPPPIGGPNSGSRRTTNL